MIFSLDMFQCFKQRPHVQKSYGRQCTFHNALCSVIFISILSGDTIQLKNNFVYITFNYLCPVILSWNVCNCNIWIPQTATSAKSMVVQNSWFGCSITYHSHFVFIKKMFWILPRSIHNMANIMLIDVYNCWTLWK